MNELIKRLVEQCEEHPYALHTIDLEKFAESIVRECIKSTLSLQTAAVEHQWGPEETFHVIVDTIVEDFDMQHIFRS